MVLLYPFKLLLFEYYVLLSKVKENFCKQYCKTNNSSFYYEFKTKSQHFLLCMSLYKT